MSWFSINVSDFAKNALSEAQKKIDQALDIQGKESTTASNSESFRSKAQESKNVEQLKEKPATENVQLNIAKKKNSRTSRSSATSLGAKKVNNDAAEDFFASWGEDALSGSKSPRINRPVKNITNSVKSLTPLKSSSAQNEDEFNKVLSDSDIEVIGHSRNSSLPGSSSQTSLTQTDSTEIVQPDSFIDVPLEVNIVGESESEEEFFSQGLETSLVNSQHPVMVKDHQTNDSDSNKPHTIVSEDLLTHSDSLTNSVATSSVVRVEGTIEAVCNEVKVASDVSQTIREGDESIIKEETPTEPTENIPINNGIINAINVVDEPSKEIDKSLQPMVSTETTQSVHETTQIENPNSLATEITDIKESSQEETVTDVSVEDTIADVSNHDDQKYLALSEKMEVYEQQLLTLSQRNAKLNEENDNLRTEIARAKEICQSEAEREIEEVNRSLQNYKTANKLLQEEKGNLLTQIDILKAQLASRMTNEQVQCAIAEKEESIKGLMEEGEVLAKKHLQQNNLIKKLKSQAQERETELKTLREKVESYETENVKIKDELKIAKGQGKEQRETSLRISDAYEQRERETHILQEKLAEFEEKHRTLQVNLDGAYKEIGDLHKQIAEQESKLSAEWQIKENDLVREYDLEKKKILSEQEHQRQLLMIQIMELSNSISRSEANAARREDDHRREVKELQQQIQESEGRNQDLSDNVTNATRPLLRQIENLQATHSTQLRSWNALERTLNHRLGEAQAELLAAQENERLAQNAAMEAKSRAMAYEKQIENDRKLLSKQETEINNMQKQLQDYKNGISEVTKELEDLRVTHKDSIHKSRKEKLFLENQLQMEKARCEAERKKHVAQQEALQREKEKLMWSRSEITSISSNQVAETESVGSSGDFHGTEMLERHQSSSSIPSLGHQLSYDGARAISMPNVLESLQTQVKLREGEIAQLRGEINMLEKTRSSMAEEIVRLTNLNEDMEGVSEELQETKIKLTDVEGRYSAILTMYGEKEEENEELKMDLADVKTMYRQQINDLLRDDKS